MANVNVTDVLQRALTASQLRQDVLANNIANVNTPGFKRSHVEFEQLLAKALSDGKDAKDVEPQVVQETTTSMREDGNNVDVEVEMSQVAENQIYYATLTRQLSDQFNRMRMAIRGSV